MLNHRGKLWEYSLVNFEELFSGWSVKSEHFHAGDFKTFTKNHVNNLSSKPLLNDVRLDDGTGAVVEDSSWTKTL